MDLFENLKYRVDLIKGENIPDQVKPMLKLPKFKEYMASKTPLEVKAKIIKYIGLMYDPASPYPVEFLDLDRRKKQVAKECNFTPKRNDKGIAYVFTASYQQFIDVDSDLAKGMILSFLKHIHYAVWTEIQTTEQELWEITQLRWERIATKRVKTTKRKKGEEDMDLSYESDIDDKDVFDATNKKEKLMLAAQKRREYLKELYKEMFDDNNDVKQAAIEILSPENAYELVH
jgi:hypothetical protein